MCQRKPGPRCTAHAKAQVRAAMEGVKALSPEAGEQAVHQARLRLTKATFDYDATPGGQTALKKSIEKLNKQRDDTQISHERISLYAKISRYEIRLRRGQNIRDYQEQALKQLEEQEGAKKRRRSRKTPTLSSRWRDSDKVKTLQCSNGDEIHVFNENDPYSNPEDTYSKIAWRTRQGEPVAMVRFYDSTYNLIISRADGGWDKIPTAVLTDIEVKPEARGNGLGVDTIRSLNAEYGQLHTNGSFSANGFRSLSDALPLYQGAKIEEDPSIINYNFVNWEEGDFKRDY